MLIAVTATAVGFAFDAGTGHQELTIAFAALYVLGCVTAVLAVRHSGLFAAVIQPPLILFCSVPTAYWLFHDAEYTGIKDTLINYGYPLIERFPLMLFTSAIVLLIGMIRWYLDMRTASATPQAAPNTAAGAAKTGLTASITTKLAGLWARDPAEAAEAADKTKPRQPPRHSVDRRAAAAKPRRRAAPTRSKRARPHRDKMPEPPREPPRRRQSARDPDPRNQPPREYRRDPRGRRAHGERPSARGSRYDPHDPAERTWAPNGTNGGPTTHHPISKVRYRRTAEPGETSSEFLTRPTPPTYRET